MTEAHRIYDAATPERRAEWSRLQRERATEWTNEGTVAGAPTPAVEAEPVAEDTSPSGAHRHWRVTVETGTDQIVCIETECLSGRDISGADEATIRQAGLHLLAFAGVSHPQDAESLRGEVERLTARVAELEAAADAYEPTRLWRFWDEKAIELVAKLRKAEAERDTALALIDQATLLMEQATEISRVEKAAHAAALNHWANIAANAKEEAREAMAAISAMENVISSYEKTIFGEDIDTGEFCDFCGNAFEKNDAFCAECNSPRNYNLDWVE